MHAKPYTVRGFEAFVPNRSGLIKRPIDLNSGSAGERSGGLPRGVGIVKDRGGGEDSASESGRNHNAVVKSRLISSDKHRVRLPQMHIK